MNGEKKDSEKVSDLRKRTEDALQGKNEDLKGLSTTDARSLVSELQVHQTELEMQNEELRKAKKELEDVRNSYSDLYDFAPVGYFTFDKNGLIYKMNLTSAAKLGMERGFLIKKPFSNYISKSSKDVFYSHLHQVFNTGKRQTCEIKLQDKKGIEFDAQLETIPEQEIEGNINRCKTIVIDITERKRAEKAAEELGRYAESIVETVREPLLVMDANLNIISASRNFYKSFKTTPEDTIGKFIYDLGNHQWDIPALRTLLEDILPKETKFENFEVKHDFQTLGNKTMLLNAREIRREDIGTKTILLAIEDITERKQIEEGLLKAHKILKDTQEQLIHAGKMAAMGEMAAGVAHELTQPLLGINGFATALLEDLKRYREEKSLIIPDSQVSIEKFESDLEVILKQTDRMTSVINSVRNFAHGNKTEKAWIYIDKSINDALMLFSEQFRVHNITLEKNLAPGLPMVLGNANQLQQVFINLFTNARDAIDAMDAKGGKGRLTITTGVENSYIYIKVKDTGIGADKETMSQMFQPFFTTKKAGQGIGLGLIIVKRILDEHKGTIDILCEPGRGCTFTIRLPAGTGGK